MEKMLNKSIIVYMLIAVFLGGCLGKDHLPKPMQGDLVGRVVDGQTQAGIPGVTIDFGNGLVTVSDLNGSFCFEVLPPGQYQVKLQRDWYQPKELTVRHVGKKDPVVLVMQSQPLPGAILYNRNENSADKQEIFCLELKNRKQNKILGCLNSSEIQPSFRLPNQLIYTSDKQGKKDLYCYNLTTKEDQIISNSLANTYHPSVSQDSNVLVFESNRNGKKEVFLSNLNNLNSIQMIAAGQNPVVSHDGSQVAYVDGSYRLWIYDIKQNQSRMINLPYKVNNPSWAPDQIHLAVEGWSGSGQPHLIYVVNTHTNTWEQITYRYTEYDSHEHPSWSSDGTLIFFAANITSKTKNEIYCIRKDDALSLKEKAIWVMVSGGAGSKDNPVWVELD
ncbi:MAG TPA: hypothetical protein PLZ08_04420 [Bacillota bacterium]|jgi:Tol biopolymer transport system component|nr:hypothetical protein [Bacillota bacterium]HPO97186.1 hypothetical protein [Bacillota bacterium]